MTKNRLIAFDMDGTLVDSAEAIGRFLTRLHLRLGLKKPSREELKRIQGESASEVLGSVVAKKAGSTALEIRRLVEWTNRVYPRHYMLKYAKRIPGVADTIRTISSIGYIVIISSNVGNAVRELISWEDIEAYVGPPSYQSEYESKRDRLINAQRTNNVLPSHTVYIGDSATDMKMGRDLGVRTVAVLRLSSNREEVSRMADVTVEDITEIPSVLEGWEKMGFFGLPN